jgi:cytochrome c-type biogenesis protein CcmH/NrfG
VSSLAGTEPAPAPTRGRTLTIAVPGPGWRGAIAGGVALTLLLASLVATGGLQLERTTDVTIAFLLGSGALCVAAILRHGRGGPLHGGSTLLAVGLLTALSGASVVWSLAPSDSAIETGRTLSYLGLLAAGVALARLAPSAWSGLIAGVAAGCVLVCAWALLTKVFPAALAPEETYARLREPFEYWNSVGLMAAMGVPPLLWLAARRSGHAALNALAWPGLALLLICLMLSYSRGALIALAAGVALWLAIVPLRLRGLAALAGGIAGAAALVVWAFAQDGLTTDNAPMAARVDAGHEFGALLALLCTVLLLAGLAVQFAAARRPLPPRLRRGAGIAILGVLALVPLAGVVAVATAPGGIDGQASKTWHQLTDINAATPANTPDRLTATSSVRARYWHEALKIHGESPWVGAGAGAYATARTHFKEGRIAVRHAHGYVVQTLADLGWAGLAVSLLATLAWLVAAVRTAGLRPRDRGLPWDAERVGIVTMVAVVVVFGVHSALDWTWFVPGNAAAALLCAGWVAGRGPLRARLLRAEPAAAPAAAPAWTSPAGRRRSLRRGRAAAAALVAALALAASWAAYQPVRAQHAADAAFDRLAIGQPQAAADIARIAVRRNPLSVEPLFAVATVEDARGNLPQAEAALADAVKLQPANAEAWRRLGRFRLTRLEQPKPALEAFQVAYYLDPASPSSLSDVVEASRAAAAG